MTRWPWAFTATLLFIGTSVHGQDPITVSEVWLREPVARSTTTAAYAVLENTSAEDIALTAVTTEVAKTVELHEMVMAKDIMDMRPVKEIRIPASSRVELKPGGLHLMLFGLSKPLKDGDMVPLTFITSRGWTIQAQARVRARRIEQ